MKNKCITFPCSTQNRHVYLTQRASAATSRDLWFNLPGPSCSCSTEKRAHLLSHKTAKQQTAGLENSIFISGYLCYILFLFLAKTKQMKKKNKTVMGHVIYCLGSETPLETPSDSFCVSVKLACPVLRVCFDNFKEPLRALWASSPQTNISCLDLGSSSQRLSILQMPKVWAHGKLMQWKDSGNSDVCILILLLHCILWFK